MRKNWMRATTGVLSAIMLAGAVTSGMTNTTVYAATEHYNDASKDSTDWQNWKNNWDAYSSNYENVSLTPGVNETQLNLAWYSHTQETPKVRISTSAEINETNSTEFTGSQTTAVEISGQQYYSNKVTVTGLTENTKYYYQVLKNGEWQAKQEYSTKSFTNFSFLYVGDPQIGASKGQGNSESETLNAKNALESTAEQNLAGRNDSYNWNKILNNAMADHPEVSFLVSAGDQVNYAVNEREYAGYLGADALKSLPVSTTIGNHDSGSEQYSFHYNNPNVQTEESTTAGKTKAGTDYYYTYGGVLFIVLDTNNYNCATHKNVIAKAVSENPNAKWRVVMFHQDIYGSGLDHSDSDGMVLRTQLTPIMDEYDIDVVLQGHDHTYSRTYQLKGDGAQHTAFSKGQENEANFIEQNNCYQIVSDTIGGKVVNPEGTVYLEANSATGSKFYNLIATKQDFISERSQTWTPTYSVISVTDNTFSVSVYDSATRKALAGSTAYTIVKSNTVQITGTDTYTKTLGDAAFTLDAAASNGASLSYDSSDENVATVSKNGKVSICGVGTAKIKITTEATEQYLAGEKEVVIKVNDVPAVQPVEKATTTITGTAAYTKTVGDATFTLDAAVTNGARLSYDSSDENVAIVSQKGKVSILGAGTTVITVTSSETDTYKSATKQITITVNAAQATEQTTEPTVVEKNNQSITGTDTYTMSFGAKKFKLNCKTTGDGKLTYSSSNKKVVTVDKNGTVKVVGCGVAKITVKASATDRYKAASKQITITVNPKQQVAKLSNKKKGQVQVSWNKDTKVSGYEIVYSFDKNFKNNVTTKTISKNATNKFAINKLQKGKVIYVKVRAYKKISGGKILYGNYSKVVKITVK